MGWPGALMERSRGRLRGVHMHGRTHACTHANTNACAHTDVQVSLLEAKCV